MGNSSSNELTNSVNRSNDKIKNDLQNSLAQTARGVDRTNRAVDTSVAKTNNDIKVAFAPVEKGFNKTFSKANMEQFDDELVTGLKDSSRILGKIGDVGDKILNNPVTQIASNIPILGEGIGALRAINTGVKAGGKLYGGLGDIADRKNYEGKSGTAVTTNVLEKSIKTGEDVAGTGIRFA